MKIRYIDASDIVTSLDNISYLFIEGAKYSLLLCKTTGLASRTSAENTVR